MGELGITKFFQNVFGIGGNDAAQSAEKAGSAASTAAAGSDSAASSLDFGDSVLYEPASPPGLFDRFAEPAPMTPAEARPSWLDGEMSFTPADPGAYFDRLTLQPPLARPAAEARIEDGVLVHDRVENRIYDSLHKGDLGTVRGLIVHQTAAPSAEATFSAYDGGGNGAHFLIGKDGSLYQTARLDQQTWHVGKLRSRCYELHECSAEAQQAATDVYHEPGKSYSSRVKALHEHELAKDYPDRYPSNGDSLGIELVGDYLEATETYEAVSAEQNDTLKWLTGELKELLGLEGDDVYRHPEVSYKQPSEAETADWEGD